jgi:hypothetical protein
MIFVGICKKENCNLFQILNPNKTKTMWINIELRIETLSQGKYKYKRKTWKGKMIKIYVKKKEIEWNLPGYFP